MNLEQNRSCKALIASIAFAIIFVTGAISKAEDGYRLWLRYDPLPKRTIESYRPRIASVVVPGDSATLEVVRTELVNGCTGLLASAAPPPRARTCGRGSPLAATLLLLGPDPRAGPRGRTAPG